MLNDLLLTSLMLKDLLLQVLNDLFLTSLMLKDLLLQVLKDDAKSRREVELHWRAATCANIVNIR